MDVEERFIKKFSSPYTVIFLHGVTRCTVSLIINACNEYLEGNIDPSINIVHNICLFLVGFLNPKFNRLIVTVLVPAFT